MVLILEMMVMTDIMGDDRGGEGVDCDDDEWKRRKEES